MTKLDTNRVQQDQKTQLQGHIIVITVLSMMLAFGAIAYLLGNEKYAAYKPAHAGICLASTAINPACWVGYALDVWKGK